MSDMRKLIEQVEKLTEDASPSGVGYVILISDSDGDRYLSKGSVNSNKIQQARIFLSLATAIDTAENYARHSDGEVTIMTVIISVDKVMRKLKGGARQ